MEAPTTASSATPATAVKAATGAARSLETAALSPSRELLAAGRAALGSGAGLSAVARVESRALCGEARTAAPRCGEVGVLCQSLSAALSTGARGKVVSSRAGRC